MRPFRIVNYPACERVSQTRQFSIRTTTCCKIPLKKTTFENEPKTIIIPLAEYLLYVLIAVYRRAGNREENDYAASND